MSNDTNSYSAVDQLFVSFRLARLSCCELLAKF